MAIDSRDWYRDPGTSRRAPSPWPMTYALLIANVACYVLQLLSREALSWDPIGGGLGMKPEDVIGRFFLWQIFTSMFLHDPASPFHLLINMLMLWMFGRYVEQRLGKWSYLRFYLLAGLAAGLAYVVFGFFRMRGSPAVGASGAVMGILVYFTMLNPNLIVHFMFVIPMRMRWVTTLFVGIDLYYFVLNPASHGIANSAHLGGALFGFLYYRYGHRLDRFFTRLEIESSARASRRRAEELDRMQEEVDRLLAVISEKGLDGLSPKERKYLTEASRRLGRERR